MLGASAVIQPLLPHLYHAGLTYKRTATNAHICLLQAQERITELQSKAAALHGRLSELFHTIEQQRLVPQQPAAAGSMHACAGTGMCTNAAAARQTTLRATETRAGSEGAPLDCEQQKAATAQQLVLDGSVSSSDRSSCGAPEPRQPASAPMVESSRGHKV